MAKDKEPKYCGKYDPNKDPLKTSAITQKRPTIGELILVVKCASAANESSGCKAWGIDSPFQKKIEELVGPRPYGDTKESNDIQRESS